MGATNTTFKSALLTKPFAPKVTSKKLNTKHDDEEKAYTFSNEAHSGFFLVFGFIRSHTQPYTADNNDNDNSNKKMPGNFSIYVPADICHLIYQFYGKKYLILGLGNAVNGELGFDPNTNVNYRQIIENYNKLFELTRMTELVYDINQIYTAHESWTIIDRFGNAFCSHATGNYTKFAKKFIRIGVEFGSFPTHEECTEVLLMSDGVCAKHWFLMTTNHNLYSYGAVHRGQGISSAFTKVNGATPLVALNKALLMSKKEVIAQIQTGAEHTLFLLRSGLVFAMGSNTRGQCGLKIQPGNGARSLITDASEIENLPPISRIVVGKFHSCCVSMEHELFVFGDNSRGQLGIYDVSKMDVDDISNNHQCISVPMRHSYFVDCKVKDVNCGSNFTGVVDFDANVYLFGSNRCGQIGIGHKQEITAVHKIENLKVWQISLGYGHALLLTLNNQLYCCGNNWSHQCSNTCNDQYICVPLCWRKSDLCIGKHSKILRVIAGYDNTIIVCNHW